MILQVSEMDKHIICKLHEHTASLQEIQKSELKLYY